MKRYDLDRENLDDDPIEQAGGDYVLFADLQARDLKLAELAKRIPCQVARRGELTHECRVDNLCAACVIRGELLAALEETK